MHAVPWPDSLALHLQVYRLPVRARPAHPPDSAGIAVPAAQATALRAIATINRLARVYRNRPSRHVAFIIITVNIRSAGARVAENEITF